jgi:hypothetical protein
MKPPLFRLCFLVAALFPARAHAEEAPADLAIDVVVDMTDAGQKVSRPEPGRPVFYYPVSKGYTQGGEVLQGENTPPPPPKVERMIALALQKEGYLYCGKTHAPSLLLMLWWGYKAPVIMDNAGNIQSPSLGGGPTGGQAAINAAFRTGEMPTESMMNKVEMEELVFGSDYEPESYRNLRSLRLERLVEASRVPRYYVMISALDFAEFMKKHPVVLWTARVSVAREGHTLDEVLPALINAAGPMLGRKTRVPQWSDGTTVPRGHVEAGTPVMKAGAPGQREAQP